MKNNIAFFSHYIDAYTDGKFLILRAYYGGGERGWAMEARFWAFNCMIGKADDCRLDLSSKRQRAEIVQALGLNLSELDEFLHVIKDEAELVHEENGIYTTSQTQKDLERAMSTRIAQKDRRMRALHNENETLGNESDSSSNENNGAEQSRAEQNSPKIYKSSKQAQSSREVELPPAAAAFILIDEIRNTLRSAPFKIRLSQRDFENISVHLSSNALDTGFVEYVIERANADGKNKGAFARSALLGKGEFATMPEEYRDQKGDDAEQEPDREPPPDKCDECGGQLVHPTSDMAGCPKCRIFWEWDAFGYWAKSKQPLEALPSREEFEAMMRRRGEGKSGGG